MEKKEGMVRKRKDNWRKVRKLGGKGKKRRKCGKGRHWNQKECEWHSGMFSPGN